MQTSLVLSQNHFRNHFSYPLVFSDLLSSPSSNETTEPNAVINAHNLYDSCVDEAAIEADGVEAVLNIINNEFGGWPILQGGAWNASTFNLTDLLIKLRAYDDGIIFSVVTATNQENSSVYDIEVTDHFYDTIDI